MSRADWKRRTTRMPVRSTSSLADQEAPLWFEDPSAGAPVVRIGYGNAPSLKADAPIRTEPYGYERDPMVWHGGGQHQAPVVVMGVLDDLIRGRDASREVDGSAGSALDAVLDGPG